MNIVSTKATIGDNFRIGAFCIIEDDVVIGDNVEVGNCCHIRAGVRIGNGTKLMNYVELRSDTTIGERCYVDSKVSSSGAVVVGNDVTLRYDTILARGCEVGDGAYISPRVMTNNLNSEGSQIGGAKIGARCFIGTNAVLHHGIRIADDVTIGAMSFVNKDCVEEGGTYFGCPARQMSKT